MRKLFFMFIQYFYYLLNYFKIYLLLFPLFLFIHYFVILFPKFQFFLALKLHFLQAKN